MPWLGYHPQQHDGGFAVSRTIKPVRGVYKCLACGAAVTNQQQPHLGGCLCSPDQGSSKPGLGDRVASALAAVGITKERVSKALGKPCGCAKRQAKLNELGRKLGIG